MAAISLDMRALLEMSADQLLFALSGLSWLGTLLVIAGVMLEGEETVRAIKVSGFKPTGATIGFILLVLGLAIESAAQNFTTRAEQAERLDTAARIKSLEKEVAAQDALLSRLGLKPAAKTPHD